MTLKLAVWDIDGTIVDSRKVIQAAMVRAFEAVRLAPPPYEATRQIVGLSLDEACRTLAPDLDTHALPGLVDAYRTAFVSLRGDPDFHEPLYDGALDTLERLARDGWLLAIATGKSRRGVHAIFETHGLARLFDTVWCADDGPGKPHPHMLKQAMNALGVEPQRAVMIGDSKFDMEMARAARVSGLGVTWGFGTASELSGAGAHAVHDTFESLDAAFDILALP